MLVLVGGAVVGPGVVGSVLVGSKALLDSAHRWRILETP